MSRSLLRREDERLQPAFSEREHAAGIVTELPRGAHLDGLNGLRGLAVAAVLLFHAEVGWMRGGFLGVDLFFALSGWLITSLLLREGDEHGSVRLSAFWGRRIRRLMPAALTTIAAVVVWGWIWGKPYETSVGLADAPWAQYNLANWHQISTSGGYWASFGSPSPFNHMWSLAIEEQFYIVWPLAMFLLAHIARRRLHGVVLAVSVVGSLASLTAMLALYHGGDATRVYMGTDTRAASLLVGAALATAPARRVVAALATALRGRVNLLMVAILGALGVMWARTDGTSATWLFRGGLLGHSLLSAALVCLVGTVPRSATSRALGWRPLTALGAISYGLYLWHWPIYIVLNRARTGLHGVPLIVLRIAVSIAVATVSYFAVEKPLRTRRLLRSPRAGLAGVVVAMAVVTALIVAVPSPKGSVAGVDVGSVAAALGSTTVAPATTAPAAQPTVTTSPVTGPSAVPVPTSTVAPTTSIAPKPLVRSMLWWGDSIAFDEAPAIIAAVEAAGPAVTSLAYPGKGMVESRIYDPANKVPAELRSAGAFDLVVAELSEWDLTAPSEVQIAGLEAFYTDVDTAQPGASVVFLTAPPTVQTPGDDPDRVRLLQSAETVAGRHPGRAWLLDTAPLWGPVFVRDMDGDGIPERKADNVHICPSGAARFAAWLVTALSTVFDGFDPQADLSWIGGSWTAEKRYNDPPGTCARLG